MRKGDDMMKYYKKYFSFFSLQFNMGLQYRVAALSGVVTQLLWGFMECLAFRAFQETNPSAYPMTLSATVSYMWLKEAFFAAFVTWSTDGDIFDSIINGGIAYEMCRPISIYNMWFSETAAGRIARGTLRSIPLLTIAFMLPEPFRMKLPVSPLHFVLFIVTLFLGLGVTVAFCMFTYILAFFTISPQGLRMLFTSMVEFLSGAIIPLPFMPDKFRHVVELLPFASMINVPFRIYVGDLAGAEMIRSIGVQSFWLVLLVGMGKALCKAAEKKTVVQGG